MIFKISYNKFHKGNVTIVLSLILTILLSAIFTLLESARLTVIKTHYTDISYLCMDSLFGDFCYELFDKYGIFAINSSDVNPDNFLKEYAADNVLADNNILNFAGNNYNLLKGSLKNVTTSDYIYLTDKDGEVFSNQILAYMKYKEVSEITESLTNSISSDGVDIYDFTDESFDVSDMDLSYLDNISTEDRRECLDISDEEAASYKDNFTNFIAHALQNNLLLLLVDDPDSISVTKVDKLTLPSMTTALSDETTVINEGYVKESSFVTPEKILFEEYVSSIFGSYTNPKADSLLTYELEYIINGSSEDDKNLLNTAIKLIFMRGSFNASYILSDPAKRTAVKDFSQKCVGNAPLVLQFTEFMVLSAWSVAEGIIDVKDLLLGKKVPLIKDSSSWTLSLDKITSVSPHTISSNTGENGFDYSFYLKLLLVAQSELALRFRTMDLIQMNICLNYNETFRIQNCICGMKAEFSYETPNIFLNFNNLMTHSNITDFSISTTYTYD